MVVDLKSECGTEKKISHAYPVHPLFQILDPTVQDYWTSQCAHACVLRVIYNMNSLYLCSLTVKSSDSCRVFTIVLLL